MKNEAVYPDIYCLTAKYCPCLGGTEGDEDVRVRLPEHALLLQLPGAVDAEVEDPRRELRGGQRGGAGPQRGARQLHRVQGHVRPAATTHVTRGISYSFAKN